MIMIVFLETRVIPEHEELSNAEYLLFNILQFSFFDIFSLFQALFWKALGKISSNKFEIIAKIWTQNTAKGGTD